MNPYDMDFDDYVASRGGVYLPFPEAVRFVYGLDWCRSIWEALVAGIRPPAHRVRAVLEFQPSCQSYLPPWIAKDYPDVPNPNMPSCGPWMSHGLEDNTES